ncbi:MAG: hypothetical protein JSR97_03845 [Verrucomicrobia bacterium]|nr:hypothetical protein [Verrucomicrobiota bacterium]
MTRRAADNKSICAIGADGSTIGFKSLPIFSYRVDRLLIRQQFLATLLVLLAGFAVSIKFTFFNKHLHRADTASNTQLTQMLDVTTLEIFNGNNQNHINNADAHNQNSPIRILF